jgi:site-specific DNA recombinase
VPVRQAVHADRRYGGGPFSRGQLYKLLANPVCIGQIAHRAERWPGLHQAIIDPGLWEKVQSKLASNGRETRTRVHAKDPSLLAGLLFDAQGDPLVATHATRKGRRYRYYVSRALEHGAAMQRPSKASAFPVARSNRW